MKVETVFELVSSNDVDLRVKVDGAGQAAATSAYNSAKSDKRRAILKGFLIDGSFKPVDLRDHFRRMSDRNR